jgi:hypothetical protein
MCIIYLKRNKPIHYIIEGDNKHANGTHGILSWLTHKRHAPAVTDRRTDGPTDGQMAIFMQSSRIALCGISGARGDEIRYSPLHSFTHPSLGLHSSRLSVAFDSWENKPEASKFNQVWATSEVKYRPQWLRIPHSEWVGSQSRLRRRAARGSDIGRHCGYGLIKCLTVSLSVSENQEYCQLLRWTLMRQISVIRLSAGDVTL